MRAEASGAQRKLRVLRRRWQDLTSVGGMNYSLDTLLLA